MIVPVCDCVSALYCLQNSMMLTPCGPSAVPTGGAGVACPAGIWSFTIVATFFFPGTLVSLDLRDLIESEFDRRLAAEDVHEHLELRAIDVDIADDPLEVGERSGDHAHVVSVGELQPRFRPLLRT